MRRGVSVIICTYNGASRLRKTIQHLACQMTDKDIGWELIFVDNSSTDNSADVVREEWTKSNTKGIHLTVLKEERAGKIFALEQAFKTAQYEYAVICDDDNWLNPDYLQLVFEILEKNPSIGAVGGQGIATSDQGTFPVWFQDCQESYAVGKQGLSTGDITYRGHVWGAGMGTRTSLYREMYRDFPSLLTGRLGNSLTAGEDAEYCQRLVLSGYNLYYDSRLVFRHYMPELRLQESYRERLFEGFKEADHVLDKYYAVTKYLSRYSLHPAKRIGFIISRLLKAALGSNVHKRSSAKAALIFATSFPVGKDAIISKIISFYKYKRKKAN